MSNNLALESRKNTAKEEFKYILQTYILPLVQCEDSLIFKDEQASKHKLSKHITCHAKRQEYFLYFFPTLQTPQFHYRIRTKNPKQELGAAEKILREIMFVSNFDYRTPDFTFSNYYDKEKFIYRNTRIRVTPPKYL